MPIATEEDDYIKTIEHDVHRNIYLHILQNGKFQTTNTTKISDYFDQHSRWSLKVLAFSDIEAW